MYGLLTKCEVKMAGYWPSAFFCVFTQKLMNKANIQSYPASLVNKRLIIWDKTPKHDLCTCGTKPVPHLCKIAPSCPLG